MAAAVFVCFQSYCHAKFQSRFQGPQDPTRRRGVCVCVWDEGGGVGEVEGVVWRSSCGGGTGYNFRGGLILGGDQF